MPAEPLRTSAGGEAVAAGGDVTPVEPDRFREVLGGVCTPVAVVTTRWDGRPHGTTVSAFCSLSLRPPLVLVALARDSDLLGLVRRSGAFGVNVLAAEHESLAVALARKGTDKGESVAWDRSHALPRLRDASGWLACRLERIVDGGDHEIVIGLVVEAERRDRPPLLYRNRAFTTVSAGGER